jgi:hypothetical protein
LKGYKYFEIERDFLINLVYLIDGDSKFGVLLLVFVRFLGGDAGNLYQNVFFEAGLHIYSAQPFY